MQKKIAYLSLASLSLTTASLAFAQDNPAEKISLSAEISHAQKYMWRGFDLLEEDGSAIQPSLNIDFGESGFYMGLWASYSYDSKWRESNETDFYAGYYQSFWQDKRYALDTDFSYIYFYYPKLGSDEDTQEIGFSFEFSELLPQIGSANLVPYSALYYGWSSKGGSANEKLWIKLGASYELSISPLTQQQNQAINFHIETFYHDGAEPDVNSGWSHIATGASTTLEWHKIALTPSINYQQSLEETVNEENEFWFTLNLAL